MTNKEEIEWIKKDLSRCRIENAELLLKVNGLRSEIYKSKMKYRNSESDLCDLKIGIKYELETIKNNWFIKWITKI